MSFTLYQLMVISTYIFFLYFIYTIRVHVCACQSNGEVTHIVTGRLASRVAVG